MPLLHKKAFIRKRPPAGVNPNDKVFYCELTNEAFSDYDEYWERLVLCNAMVWTCEVTGRPNLTFQEAQDNEAKALKFISNISPKLKLPMLYLANRTRRGRQSDVSEDVFNHVRDRYYPGEPVEAIVSNHWYDCKVVRIIEPTAEEIAQYERDMADSDDEASADPLGGLGTQGSAEKPITLDDDDDIQIISESPAKTPKPATPIKKQPDNSKKENYPPYATYKYEVEEEQAWDYKTCKRHFVTWEQIRRTKNALTRDKCKLFLKLCTEMSSDGFFTVKKSLVRKYKLDSMKYRELFPAEDPKFAESKSKKMSLGMSPRSKEAREKMQKKENKKRDNKENGEEKSKEGGVNGDEKKRGRPSLSQEEKLSRKLERMKKLAEETDPSKTTAEAQAAAARAEKILEAEQQNMMQLKQAYYLEQKEKLKKKLEKEKADKKQERDVKKEHRRLLAIEMKEWLKPREDLTVCGHKNLPSLLPVQCGIPNELFGDFLSILEFINNFNGVLELHDVYPNGITFEMLENAIVTKEVAGVFNDVVQLLLGAVFSIQEEEDKEITADTTFDPAMFEGSHCEDDKLAAAFKLANRASHWAPQYHGTSIHQLPLDALTLTEVLRIHLMSSGAGNVANAQWRHLNRGGYKDLDDPGLQFKLDHPELVAKLSTKSIFDMHIEEKVKILHVLMQQIVTYAGVRDVIEETFEKIREVKTSLREHQQSAKKIEREEHAAKVLKKKEIKQKAVSQAQKSVEQAIKKSESETVEETNEEEESEETEEERKEREEREEKIKEKRKQEHSKKENEMKEQIMDLSAKVNPVSLGQDRAYRRYWVFNSIPGVFIEDDEPYPGTCCEIPTQSVVDPCPDKCTDILNKLEREAKLIVNPELLDNNENPTKDVEEKANTSDKENDTSALNSPKVNGAFGSPLINNDIPDNKNINKILIPPPVSSKKLLKASNAMVNGTPKNSKKSSKDQSITKFFAKSPKVNDETVTAEVSLVLSKFSADGSVAPSDTKVSIQIKDVPPKAEEVKEEVEEPGDVFGLCTADPETCKVHTKDTGRPKWSFIYREEDLDALIAGLNERGERESALKENLILFKSKISQNLKACPVYLLNPSEDTEHDTAVRKSKRATGKKGGDSDTNLNFPLGTSIDHILELTLRDMILEVEEKLYVGVLGRLVVGDRDKWRTCLTAEGSLEYEPQKLSYGGKERINKFKSSLGLDVGTPEVPKERDCNVTVKMLTMALLQVAQSIDAKYLKPPLAETEKQKAKRIKAENKLKRIAERRVKEQEEQQENGSKSGDSDSDSDEEDSEVNKISDNALSLPLERWEESLMASVSYSQVFLHLATLDNSVTWSRSLTKTRCRVCRKGGDHEKMLLCDGCDKGHHIYCLKPKLKSIPEGDWFCDKCKPKLKPKSPAKKRKVYVEEEMEEEEVNEEEQQPEEEEEEEEERGVEEEEEIFEDDYCDVCSTGGELLCCDGCPRTFHVECVRLRKIPRGNWLCQHCTEAKNATKEEKTKKEEKSKRTSEGARGVKRKAAANLRGKKQVTYAEEEEENDSAESEEELQPSRKRKKTARYTDGADDQDHSSRPSRRTGVEKTDLHPDALHQLMTDLYAHEESWPFLKPVNKKKVPDYYQLIKKPMDFQTMREKLNCAKYLTDEEFLADCLLVFQNCQQYNMEDTAEYNAGTAMARYLKKRATELGLKGVAHHNGVTRSSSSSRRTTGTKRKRTSF